MTLRDNLLKTLRISRLFGSDLSGTVCGALFQSRMVWHNGLPGDFGREVEVPAGLENGAAAGGSKIQVLEV